MVGVSLTLCKFIIKFDFYKLRSILKVNCHHMRLHSPIIKSLLVTGIFTFLFFQGVSQQVSNIEPPNWWVGMNNRNLELMVHGENLHDLSPSIDSELVKLVSIQKTENPNYLWLNIEINSNATPGEFTIEWRKIGKSKIHTATAYALLERSSRKKGIDQSDLMYLIMPDRFSKRR